jgi:intergrase/recombinase
MELKTITLGQFRFRLKNERVYLYLVLDGKHEKYIAPLDKIVESYLKSQDNLLSSVDSKGKIEGGVNGQSEGEAKGVTRNEGGLTSVTELQRFFNYCVKFASEQTCKTYVKYLQKPVSSAHASIKAWRMYYKLRGEEDKLKKLKLPKSGSDLRLVTEWEVKEALSRADEQSRYILTLLLESGARLSEVVKALNEYDPTNETEEKSSVYTYYIYNMNWKRGRKRAFYLFHVTPLRQMHLDYDNVKVKLSRYINSKYIRKFVATKLYEMGVPTEVVDFLQGRAQESVATKHYIYLFTSAKKAYEEKWLPYVKSLLNLNIPTPNISWEGESTNAQKLK